MGTRKKSIDGPGSTQQSDPQPTEMSASQKIASHVRKVSQLSSALGVSHVKNLSPAMENKNNQQHFQILHTAVQGQEREVIGQNRAKEGKTEEMREEWKMAPLPAKRWEQDMSLQGLSSSVVGESKKSS